MEFSTLGDDHKTIFKEFYVTFFFLLISSYHARLWRFDFFERKDGVTIFRENLHYLSVRVTQ